MKTNAVADPHHRVLRHVLAQLRCHALAGPPRQRQAPVFDPAHGQRKSLEATYRCGDIEKSASANEHRTIYLDGSS